MVPEITKLTGLSAAPPPGGIRLEGLGWYAGSRGGRRRGPVGIRAGRFTFLDLAEAEPCRLDGLTLLPGLCDAHIHLFHEARRLLQVDLGSAKSCGEIGRQLASAPAEGPVIGVDWDESTWAEPRFPTLAELDEWVPDRPAGIVRICGHVAVANSAALAEIGPQRYLDAATGVLLEESVYALTRRFAPDAAILAAAAGRAALKLASQGITAITEMGAANLPERAAALAADFPLRVEYFHNATVADLPASAPAGARIRPLGLKFFLDGSIGGRSAAVSRPYLTGGEGKLLIDEKKLAGSISAALEAGWRVALHAIGDRAIGQALRVLSGQGGGRGRCRIEHLEMATADQLLALGGIGAIGCLQPNFMDRWGRAGGLYEQRLGEGWRERFPGPGALRAAGLILAYGTDGMPARLHPALAAACDGALFGEQADGGEAALAAVTADAAVAAGSELEWGRIAEGLSADFCLARRDIVAEDFRSEAEIAMTAIAGLPTWISSP